MQSPLVSIIIPFFNEEICLPRAVESVINQSYFNFEIILVNDGSTDGSKLIAEKLSKAYSNIQLVNSLNGEPGAARNKGLALANGEYLTFLDADDELEIQMIELCVNKILITHCDIIITGHTLFDTDGKVLKIFANSGFSDILPGIETIKAVYSNKVLPTSWAKLYKTEIVKKIKFPENMWFQDTPFFLEVLFNSSRIGFIDKSLLKIHSRNNSITRRIISEKRVIDNSKAFFIELNLVENHASNTFEKDTIDRLIFIKHFQVMLDTFILLIIDKHKITESQRKDIRLRYINGLIKVKSQFKLRKLKFSVKHQILFLILLSPKYVRWRIPELLIHILKNKKISYLKRLKG